MAHYTSHKSTPAYSPYSFSRPGQGNSFRPSTGGSNLFGANGNVRTSENTDRSLDKNLSTYQTRIDDLLAQLASFGGGGGGGGGTQKQKIIDLDPFKNKELDAMRELLKQRTQGERTELTGDRARIGNAFERFEALRNKKLQDSLQTNRGSAQRRGFLDSGIFLKDRAELSNVAAGDISSEDVRSSTLVDALSKQIGGSFDYLGRGKDKFEEEGGAPGDFVAQDYGTGTLEALRSAQEASSTADIERSYLNARISQGGQG